MATEEQLKQALIKAHNAGDQEAANLFADKIKQMRASQPTFQESAEQFARDRIGTAENVASIASSALLEPIAGIAGLASEGVQALGFDAPEGADLIKTIQGAAYQPRTKEGISQQQSLGSALQTAGEFVDENVLEPLGLSNRGERALEATGSPLAATLAETAPELIGTLLGGGGFFKNSLKKSAASKRAIAERIKNGDPNVDLVTKALDDSGNIITNRRSKRALDIIKKDIGNEKAAQVVSVAENMTDASKSKVNKMLDIIERSRKEPIFGQTNRPSDILGEAVADRARAISKINNKAARNIGQVAKSLKNKRVDVSNAANNFFNDLSDLGVNFIDDNGRLKLDFSESQFVGGGADKIERLANFIKDGELNGLQAHRIKQFSRDLVDFGKGTESAVSARSQNIIKKLSSGIDAELDNLSPAYRKANERFAKTVALRDGFDKLAGKDVDIFSDMSSKSLGGKTRRLVSNAESRVQIEQLINQADDVLKNEFKIRFKDDIPSLNHMVTQLENIFKIEPVGSFQGRIQRAGSNLAQGLSPRAQVTEALTERLFDLSKPDFDKKMKAMRALTRGSNNG
jgi:hypothetical protein